MPGFSRRDLLKLAALFPPAVALSKVISTQNVLTNTQSTTLPNVIIVLFDAMTARNLSVYGYHRKTTPNFERFAEQATVYHSHNSAGNFTIPGTSSLLTGLYPWTHRALNDGGLVERDLVGRNIFKLIGKEYKRIAFSQNIWADFILSQFREDIDLTLPPSTFGITDHIIGDKFKDMSSAYRALDDFIFKSSTPGSIIFNPIEKVLYSRIVAQNLSDDYPKGLPQNINYPILYRLDDLFNGLSSFVNRLSPPFFTYFHLFSPHAPAKPSKEFNEKFNDNWHPINKPVHRLSDHYSNSILRDGRRLYDEYVATVDKEFGNFIDALDKSGMRKNTYIILTSDHGEMFERGEKNHHTPLLYDPVIHIPLIISAPGQQNRTDIFSPTNSFDVLPTLLNLVGQEIPAWCEGQLLPGFSGKIDAERSTFTVEAKLNPAFAPIKKGTIAMRKGKYKMIYYTGYEKEDAFELFDMENDLEEMTNLYSSQSQVAASMRDELLERLHKANMKQTK